MLAVVSVIEGRDLKSRLRARVGEATRFLNSSMYAFNSVCVHCVCVHMRFIYKVLLIIKSI